jgi:hypothetical protein
VAEFQTIKGEFFSNGKRKSSISGYRCNLRLYIGLYSQAALAAPSSFRAVWSSFPAVWRIAPTLAVLANLERKSQMSARASANPAAIECRPARDIRLRAHARRQLTRQALVKPGPAVAGPRHKPVPTGESHPAASLPDRFIVDLAESTMVTNGSNTNAYAARHAAPAVRAPGVPVPARPVLRPSLSGTSVAAEFLPTEQSGRVDHHWDDPPPSTESDGTPLRPGLGCLCLGNLGGQ